MRSWIIAVVVVLGICSCGLLIAQEQAAESPATTSEAVTSKEAAPAPDAAVPAVKPAAETGAVPAGESMKTEKAVDSAAPATTSSAPTTKEEPKADTGAVKPAVQ
ncbi:MAG: hypothetical protein WCP22_09650 [Chlamydiota bacterium]